MKLRRYLRLLPSVILVTGGLLVLKASGIVHDAYAGQGAAPAADAPAPAPASTPANPDYAAGDSGASTGEVDVLSSLARRSAALDARQHALDTQAGILAATEARVDAKIAQLKTLQAQISALLTQRDAAQQAQIRALIRTYGPDGMKPARAAAIFATLPDAVLVPVAEGMKPADLGAILAAMPPDAAEKLTVKLADRLALPATTPPAPEPAKDDTKDKGTKDTKAAKDAKAAPVRHGKHA